MRTTKILNTFPKKKNMLKVKKILLDDGPGLSAILNESNAKELEIYPKDRIKITNEKTKKSIICKVEITNNSKKDFCSLKKGEIGMPSDSFEKLQVKENDKVKVTPAKKPSSLTYIKNKFQGKALQEKEFKEIISDIVKGAYSDIETTYFVLACAAHPLSDKEVVGLTKAMVASGKELRFQTKKNPIILDKHCIGGVPGNRTTPLIIPIIAAAGLTIPKTSSRSITSPSGTADTMEVLCNVDLHIKDLYKIVKEHNACIIWGGALELSPADDIIINVEHPLELDFEGQMIASILSKKKSAGSTHILLDIPYGKGAKVEKKQHARRLQKRFETIGKKIGLTVKTMLSDGSQPVGKSIGPLYEAKEVLEILENKVEKKHDQRQKALEMAGIMLEMAGQTKKGKGKEKAEKILSSGAALQKLQEIIKAQGEKKIPKNGKYSYEVKAERKGTIKSINNKHISDLAFILGAPKDKAAGLILNKKVDEKTTADETLFTLYSNSKLKLDYAKIFLKNNTVYELSKQ